MAAPLLHTGTVLEISHVAEDDQPIVYTATQQEETLSLPLPVPASRREFSLTFGPAKFTGYIVIETLEIGVEVYVLGIKLGSFYGNAKQGVVIKVNLFLVTGQIRFYLKGKELWVHVDLKVKFDGSFKTDVKLLHW